MKQGKENFEVVKNEEEKKKNYIFKTGTLTVGSFYFILVILILLIAAVAFTSLYL